MNNKKLLLFFAVLAVLISNVFAVDTLQNVSDIFEETTQTGSYELLSEWRVLAVMVLLVTGLLIAIAYAIAIAFELPDIKAWAGVELSQLISNAIIVAFVLIILSFLDFAVMFFVHNSGVDLSQYPSSTSTLYSIKAATAYLDGLIGLGESNFDEFVVSAEKAGRESAKRYGLSCNMFIIPIPCLFFGISFSVGGNAILDVERYTYLVDHNNNILSALYAQRFFVESVIYKIGPILLALGILARAFFVTRRMGGLLMAIAIGLMFIFPMTYIFNWMTINVVVMGDKLFGPISNAPGCPQICKEEIPIAVLKNGESLTYSKAVQEFGAESAVILKKNLDRSGYESSLPPAVSNKIHAYCNAFAGSYVSDMGLFKMSEFMYYSWKGAPDDAALVKSFYTLAYGEGASLHGEEAIIPIPRYLYCPERCRQIPYPMEINIGGLNSSSEGAGSLLACSNPLVRDICSYLPKGCFAERVIWNPQTDPSVNQEQLNKCPDHCKIIPPLNSKCRGDMVIVTLHARCGSCFTSLWSGWSSRINMAKAMCDKAYNDKFANTKSSQDMLFEKHFFEGGLKYTTVAPFESLIEYDGDGGAFDCTEHIWTDCPFPGTYFITYYKYDSNKNPPTRNLYLPGSKYNYDKTGVSGFYDGFTSSTIKGSSGYASGNSPYFKTGKSFYSSDGAIRPVYTSLGYIDEPPAYPITVQGGFRWIGQSSQSLVAGPTKENMLEEFYFFDKDYEYPALQWWPMDPNDPKKNCVYLAPIDTTGCDACNFVESQYTYDPVSYNDCNKRCGGEALGKFIISPAEFARMTADKMYGRSEVISVSQLIVPAYFLPLLGIAITVMFIKGFSQFLGGDIEIPGLQKVF